MRIVMEAKTELISKLEEALAILKKDTSLVNESTPEIKAGEYYVVTQEGHKEKGKIGRANRPPIKYYSCLRDLS